MGGMKPVKTPPGIIPIVVLTVPLRENGTVEVRGAIPLTRLVQQAILVKFRVMASQNVSNLVNPMAILVQLEANVVLAIAQMEFAVIVPAVELAKHVQVELVPPAQPMTIPNAAPVIDVMVVILPAKQ